jgi:hypothetical protein
MTIIEAIEEVFLSIEPTGEFNETTEVQADKDERYRNKTSTLCLVNPFGSGSFKNQNGNNIDRHTIEILFLSYVGDNHLKYSEIESNYIDPMVILGERVLTIVRNNYPEITIPEPDTELSWRKRPKWGSGNHAGAIFTFNIKQRRDLNLCLSPITYDFTLSSGNGGTAYSSLGGEGLYEGQAKDKVIAISAVADTGFTFSKWVFNTIDLLTEPFGFAISQITTAAAEFITSLQKIFGNITSVVLKKTLQEFNNFTELGVYVGNGWVDTANYSSNIMVVEEGESIIYGLYLPTPAFNLITFTDSPNTDTANIISIVSSSSVGSGTKQTGTAIVPAGATHAFIGTQTGLIPNSHYTYSVRNFYYDIATTRVITVDKSLTESIPNFIFNTIADALVYQIYGAVILIAEGTYEENDLQIDKGVSLIGANEATTIVQGYLPEDSTTALVDATSTIDAHYTCKLQNLTITAQNMRYPIHSDGGTVENTIEIDNCTIIHYGNYELWSYRDTNSIPAPNDAASTFRAMSCFGSGTKSGDIKIIKNSYLESQLRCFSTHNALSATSPSITILEDCEIVSHGIDFDNTQLDFNVPYFIQSVDSGQNDAVIINRCTGGDYLVYLDTLAHQVITNVQNLKTIYNTAGAGYSIIDQIDDCDPEFYGINQKGISNYQNNSASTIDRGSALKANSTGVELMTSSDSAEDFFGIALQDITPTGYGDCITKGYLLRKYMLGLESTVINEGDSIGVQADGSFDVIIGVIVATASTDQNVIINNTDIVEPLFEDSIFYNWDDETDLGTITIADSEQWAIESGNDSSEFVIDANAGELTFANVHDFDNPIDVNADNIYNTKISTYTYLT